MIIVGWGSNLKILGETYSFECPNCNNEPTWQVVEISKKLSLYFVPVAKWSKHYFFMCPVCNWAIELKNREEAQDILLEVLEGKTDFLESVIIRFAAEISNNVESESSVDSEHNLQLQSNSSRNQLVVCEACGEKCVAEQLIVIQSGQKLCPECIKQFKS